MGLTNKQLFSLASFNLVLAQQATFPIGNSANRALNLVLLSDFNDIDDYGCWCHFGENFRLSRGHPQDIFDLHCRDVIRGYNCIYLDAADESSSCIPYEEPYLEPINIRFDDTNQRLYDDCTNQNQNLPNANCKIRTCLVESIFIRDLAILEESDIFPDPNLRLENGFNHSGVCDLYNDGFHERDCCGEYPFRWPYQINGNHNCCNNEEIYNIITKECCNDLTVKPVGQC